ncbi:ribonuclease P protein component [Sporosarcina sp. PTS2304]|uniref:ribonuclease P protein component n=1 Tax=Sporosarcina sp. PTS2304 TaxID=2283194 RepID=UPI000E0D7BCE|nr:ribonuclease P protein component [Sporosarcina sp. PTS2304]AXI00676.1 ribonuclease P protein component [Sporosarcina sp. PTS2304]
MKKSQRIKKNQEFQTVFKQGRSVANRQFIVYTLKKQNQEEFRIGLSVSKKVGNAVARNRIKRYIRQSFLEMKDEIKPDQDYVIIARNQAATLDFHTAKKNLQHVLKIAKAFK